jgi:PAS domain S-box-containing protein
MKKVNILIVDDRPEGLLAVQAVLDSAEYNLVTANSGTEALKYLLNDEFAVILLDVQMPVMNGFETATLIKTREKSRDIPIIFMSAINKDEFYVYQGYEAGAVDYLLKPFDPYILKSKVSIFVDIFLKNQLIKEQSQKIHQNEIEKHKADLQNLEIKNLRRYQQLADAIPQIVFRLVSDSSYEYFNKVWFEYTGLSENTSFGMSWKDVIHPEDLPNLMSMFDRAEENENIEGECRILNKAGEFRWHLFRIHTERSNESADTFSWLGTATDIEDRKRIENNQRFLAEAGEALIASLDYQQILENLTEVCVSYIADWCAVDMVNDKGHLINSYVHHRNPKKIDWSKKLHSLYLDHSQNDIHLQALATQKILVLSKALDPNENLSKLSHDEIKYAMELNETSLMIIPLIVHNKTLGTLTLANYESSKTYDEFAIELGRELSRIVALAFQNSKLYKISQEAIETRNDFFSIASHELNTPITSMKLQIQKVQRNLKHVDNTIAEKLTHSIDISMKQIDRLVELVQILLDVTHIQSGSFNFNFEKLNLKEIISDVVDRQKEIIKKRNSEIIIFNMLDTNVFWDKTRIEQLLINIISNATKYAPGKIELSLAERKENIEITVKDYGPGIPQDKLDKIFERFERIVTNESVTGLGLGLYIVKQIVEGHKGQIAIQSVMGEGTSFIITLPKKFHTEMEKTPHQEHN